MSGLYGDNNAGINQQQIFTIIRSQNLLWQIDYLQLILYWSYSFLYCMQTIIMGENNSKIIEQKKKSRKYIEDPHYGGKVIFSEVTHIVYQNTVISNKNLPSFMNLLAQRKSLVHSNFLTVKDYMAKPIQDYSYDCQNEKKTEVYIQYPYLSKTLSNVIEEYITNNTEISEMEICRIFRSVVEVLHFLKSQKTCHGDIKASNICFDHTGKVKLIDSYFVNGGKTAYQIVLENPSSMSLLSPEQLQRIKNSQFEDMSGIYKNQMFAVGLTMMEAMTFDPAMEYYDLNKMIIKSDYKLKKIKQMKQKGYSLKLTRLVSRCVAQSGIDRPSFDQFLKIIKLR